ncbi:DUF3221 domain-containing protein [Clostridium brassicae]|uniref:DUF3221 domain-containing protein n=1 Tax=Clostridium brassicae TaxID=2999072 RepID=A0ABT4DD09_9CLOT|nr:DUF3221 domain-containing protein [Clostridium brassicae]MCY6960172.1 DUF3221 domain-containing protein [Clostridium brassicae]
MKIKKIILTLLICILTVNMSAFAKPVKSPIFLGEILEVQKGNKGENNRLLVEGYIKECEVYKEKLVIIINEDTKIMKGCKEEVNNVEFKKGDKVFVTLNSAMTKSIPPQTVAKKIQVTKNK